MSDMVTGSVSPTTPPSSALDTLKALALRNIEHLDYVLDRLAGGENEVPEDVLDFLDGVKQAQYEALAEHLPVARDERLNELRYLHPSAYVYDDGTPVFEEFSSPHGTTHFYPRYHGDRATALRRHEHWAGQVEANMKFREIIDGIDWGRNGPPEDI